MKQISNNELFNVYENVIKEYQERVGEVVKVDKETIDLIIDIVNKINNLNSDTWTTIAKLINYDPQISNIDPLRQGTISMFVRNICKKIGIALIDKDHRFGGLAYFIEFKKC